MSGSSSVQRKTPFGCSMELFKEPDWCAAVLMMDYNETDKVKSVRYGGFIVNMILKGSSPVMMITCSVDGLQWPISKDAPVIRVGQRCFAFGMPGLLYGLQFPSSCEEDKIDTLETIFMKFAHYQDLNVTNQLTTGHGYPWKDDDPELWNNLRPMIETIAHNALSQFGHHPGKSPFAVGDQDSSLGRVLRTSATTKMVGEAILSGFLKPDYIEIEDMRPKKKGGGGGGGDSSSGSSSSIILEQAFASISVFTNLVEALEVYWVLASGKSHLLKEKNTNLKELVGFKMWRLKRVGITAFLKKLSTEGYK